LLIPSNSVCLAPALAGLATVLKKFEEIFMPRIEQSSFRAAGNRHMDCIFPNTAPTALTLKEVS
jgi:hypothetical protein